MGSIGDKQSSTNENTLLVVSVDIRTNGPAKKAG